MGVSGESLGWKSEGQAMPARVKEAEEQPAFGGNWMCEVGREGQGLSIVAHQLCEPGHIT